MDLQVIVIRRVVIRMWVFQKVGHPFAERPFLLRFCKTSSAETYDLWRYEILTGIRLDGVGFPMSDCIPETAHS